MAERPWLRIPRSVMNNDDETVPNRYPFLKQSGPRLVVDVEVVMSVLLILSELRCSQHCSKKLKCEVFPVDVSRGTLHFPDRRQFAVLSGGSVALILFVLLFK
ncbi:hypothetical protein P5673_019882 [Acropora cervicornis]|uniref:Uncharacterized protein n=1 Tax=Acropora cervicornis TaxID=6130 RepID=A0AAD9V1J6_ACRCE|nr:hypothetical protein P5673_019882 [Acropora cervicornis]